MFIHLNNIFVLRHKKILFVCREQFFHDPIMKIGSEFFYFDVVPAGMHAVAE
jgi:hypothetical protein